MRTEAGRNHIETGAEKLMDVQKINDAIAKAGTSSAHKTWQSQD